MGSDSVVKREIVIKPSKSSAFIGQNFDLKCHVTTVKDQLRRQPRFFGGSAVVKPEITGARDTPEAALANLLTALDNLGLITDSTTDA